MYLKSKRHKCFPAPDSGTGYSVYCFAYSPELDFGTVRLVHNPEIVLGIARFGNNRDSAPDIAHFGNNWGSAPDIAHSVDNFDPDSGSVTASPAAVSHTPAFHW